MSAALSPPRDSEFIHEALLYGSGAEFLAAIVPYVCDGVACGDEVVVISAPHNLDALGDELDRATAARVTFEQSTARYRHAAHALASFQDQLRNRAGRRMRLLAEQPIGALPPEQVDELCRGDAAFNVVGRELGASVVCTYDRRALRPEHLHAVEQSHPELVTGGARQPSPHFTEPAALLAQHHRGPPLPEPGGPVAQLPLPRDAAHAREFVCSAARKQGLIEPRLGEFVVAVNEIVTNAMVHSVPGSVRVWGKGDRVLAEVRDHGFGLTDALAGYRQPDPEAGHGWGLWLARQLTELVEVRSGPDGTVVRLHTSIDGPPLTSGRA